MIDYEDLEKDGKVMSNKNHNPEIMKNDNQNFSDKYLETDCTKDLTSEEEKAVENLVGMIKKKSGFIEIKPIIPSVEFISKVLQCDICKEESFFVRVQSLIYYSLIGDLSLFTRCGVKDEKNFEVNESESKKLVNSNESESKKLVNVLTNKPFKNEPESLVVDSTSGKEDNYKLKLSISKDEKPITKLICDICSSAFTTKNGIKYHLKFVHSKKKESIVKPYKCPFIETCKRKYKNKNGLHYHLHHHHKDDSDNLDSLYASSVGVNYGVTTRGTHK